MPPAARHSGRGPGNSRIRPPVRRGTIVSVSNAARRRTKEETMNRDLGVWTYEECALVLIDYQNEMFEVIRSETSGDLADLNVRLLSRAAKGFEVPIVLSSVGVDIGFNGPTRDSILSELEGIEPID